MLYDQNARKQRNNIFIRHTADLKWDWWLARQKRRKK